MSDATFTPGPWICEPDSHFGPGFVITAPNAGMTNRCPVVRMTSPLGDADETLEADARLIAAAPELRDGCNALLGLCTLLLGRTDLPADVRDQLQNSHRVTEARAAIAKSRVPSLPGAMSGDK